MMQSKELEIRRLQQDYQLGHLLTEGFHPLTLNFSELAAQDVGQALSTLKKVDLEALDVIEKKWLEIQKLTEHIEDCLKNQGKVFLVGCGATGRLALCLESLWRKENPRSESIQAFMAGGDTALIRSIENFEDYPEFGHRQLLEMKFGPDDLLIAITEGGETPFVIGALEKALEVSKRSPFILYCNPDEQLTLIERSRQFIENDHVIKINLTCGPMAISGSTRMQASTVLMAAVGLALPFKQLISLSEWKSFINNFSRFNTDKIKNFTQTEARIYAEDRRVLYQSNEKWAMAVLTDTTERSPTFSLEPFENYSDPSKIGQQHSLCYVSLMKTIDARDAWEKMMGRGPRTLNWAEYPITYEKNLYGWDLSAHAFGHRLQHTKKEHQIFSIYEKEGHLIWQLESELFTHRRSSYHLLDHLFLKMLLNMHSTTVMALMKRVQGNMMTWVRPNNFKLIDRSVRYASQILTNRGLKVDYSELLEICLNQIGQLRSEESIVDKIVQQISTPADETL